MNAFRFFAIVFNLLKRASAFAPPRREQSSTTQCFLIGVELQMEIYSRSNPCHSGAGGNPGALGSRLRGNDGKVLPAARLAAVLH
jgi:hypothetical protein